MSRKRKVLGILRCDGEAVGEIVASTISYRPAPAPPPGRPAADCPSESDGPEDPGSALAQFNISLDDGAAPIEQYITFNAKFPRNG